MIIWLWLRRLLVHLRRFSTKLVRTGWRPCATIASKCKIHQVLTIKSSREGVSLTGTHPPFILRLFWDTLHIGNYFKHTVSESLIKMGLERPICKIQTSWYPAPSIFANHTQNPILAYLKYTSSIPQLFRMYSATIPEAYLRHNKYLYN